MNKKAKKLSLFIFILFLFIIIEIVYIKHIKELKLDDIDVKNKFVSLISLPDLAINSQYMFVRHRTLSSVSDIFKDDPELYNSSLSTFVISPSSFNNISKVKKYD
jgi:hypothetical protein